MSLSTVSLRHASARSHAALSARALLLACCLPGAAFAADISWQDPVNGAFEDGTKWAGGVVPGAGDIAVFHKSGSGPEAFYQVDLTSDITLLQLRASSTSGSFGGHTTINLQGHNLSLSAGSGLALGIVVDYTGGSLTFTGGGNVDVAAPAVLGLTRIQGGVQLNSTVGALRYDVAVSGAGSAWSMTGDFLVGIESRQVLLSIMDGAHVSNANASVFYPDNFISARPIGVSLSGLGSTWSVAGSLAIHRSNVRVGAGALLSVDQSIILTGSAGFTPAQGSLTMAEGTLEASTIQLGPQGLFEFQSGTVRLDSVTLSPGQFLGTNYTLGANRLIDIESTTTLAAGSIFTIAGGHFRTNILSGTGTLAFTSGTFELTGQDLVIDDGGLFGDFLSLGDGRNFVVAQDVVVAAGAQFSPSGNGSLTAGRIINNGQVLLESFATNVNSDEVVNNGLILGNGRLQSNLHNESGGQVRVSAGNLMQFSGAASENEGALNILGGALEFGGTLVNSASGIVAGRGTLIVGDQLDNAGRINVSAGVTDIIGDVRNLSGGRIIVSGGSTLTLFDDFIHNGAEFRVSAGSAAVFFGAVSGAGPYTGAGTKFFEGTFSPGNSPALTLIDGDVVFGSGNTLVIELAGAAPGSGYDVIEVGGTATLGGTLRLELLDGYVPELGVVYTVLLGGLGLVGGFDQILLPTLAGFSFDLLQGSNSLAFAVSASAVPIPASVWLLMTAGALLARRRRRAL